MGVAASRLEGKITFNEILNGEAKNASINQLMAYTVEDVL